MSRYGSTDPSGSGGSSSGVPVGVPVPLVAEEVAADRNTFDGADEPQVRIKWVSVPDEAWVWDRISLWHIRDRQDGSPSKAKQLGAALSGKIGIQVAQFWIDDESWEFGFDGAKQEVAGQLQSGMRVAAELIRRADGQGIERLRVARYVPATTAPLPEQPSPPPTDQLSPDGAWRWDGKQWIPARGKPTTVGGRLI